MLIGALADATGVPAKTLRYWEAEGLLHEPARTTGGYRDYANSSRHGPPSTACADAWVRWTPPNVTRRSSAQRCPRPRTDIPDRSRDASARWG